MIDKIMAGLRNANEIVEEAINRPSCSQASDHRQGAETAEAVTEADCLNLKSLGLTSGAFKFVRHAGGNRPRRV
jgi:hypothetical protein